MIKSYPLHPAQQDVYADQILNSDSPRYNIGGYIVLKGHLNKEKFAEVLTSAPKVFDAFKLRFDSNIPEFIGFVDEEYERLKLDEIDFSTSENPADEAKAWMQKRFNTSFILQQDSLLFEQYLIKIADDEHWFFGKYHHLITDGYGFIIWVQYLGHKYKSLIAGDDVLFSYPSYVDEAAKGFDYYNSGEYKSDASYWNNKISEKPEKLLQKRYRQPDASINKSLTHTLQLTSDERNVIEDIEQLTGFRLHQLTIAALLIYFGKTTSHSDFVFGIPVHKRSSKKLRNIVGMFSGIIPFKGCYQKDITLLDLLKDISATQKNDYRHQNYLVGDLTRNLKINASEDSLFQVAINYEPFNFKLEFGEEIQASIFQLASEFARDPLQISWQDYGRQQPLQLQLEFWPEYFTTEEITSLAQRLIYIIGQFSKALTSGISNIGIVLPAERELLHSFSGTDAVYSKDKTIVDLFEEQVLKTPNAVAVIFEDKQLTYRELNERANKLAHYLQAQGVKEETLVPICIERGFEMTTGIMGILKAGGAYVPIDPEYPAERISYILQDTAASIIVTSKAVGSKIPQAQGIQIIEVDGSCVETNGQAINNPKTAVQPHHLAYVIYTSGSTGKPKGVLVEHKGVVNLIETQTKYFGVKTEERILQFSSFTFDASVEQMFLALTNGASLILISEGLQLDINRFERFLIEKQVSHLHATPSFLENLHPVNYPALKRVIAGGELCKRELSERWKNLVQFYNEYGPTETTVTAIEYNASSDNSAKNISLPIGRPLDNTSVYILNRDAELVPLGVTGELFIGGAQ
ncbi:MAG: non-ribosomal peptide synthetase, partial [Segetibacter sp.]